MKVSQKQKRTIEVVINYWKKSNQIDESTANSLLNNLEIMNFNWKKLAKYSFGISLISIILAGGILFADKEFLNWVQLIFNASYSFKFFVFSVFSILLYVLGIYRRKSKPFEIFTNESILFLAILATGTAVYQFGRAININNGDQLSLLLLFSFVIYGVIGFYFKLNFVWLFSLISLYGWSASQFNGNKLSRLEDYELYYIGLKPFTSFFSGNPWVGFFFGGILIITALIFEKYTWMKTIFKTTLTAGLCYFFSACLFLLVSNDITSNILLRHVFLAIASSLILYHGLRFSNEITKGFGITFFVINLYILFIIKFWDKIHGAIFFSVIGLSFWLLGNFAEKIWNVGKSKKIS